MSQRVWISTRLIGPVRVGYSQGLHQGRTGTLGKPGKPGKPGMTWAEFIAKTLLVTPAMAFLLTGLWPLLIGYLVLLLMVRLMLRHRRR